MPKIITVTEVDSAAVAHMLDAWEVISESSIPGATAITLNTPTGHILLVRGSGDTFLKIS